MNETILNIFLIINDGYVVEFKAIGYEREGGDDNKIKFLKSRVREDFPKAYHFDAPTDRRGKFMPYGKFSRLEKKGRQFELFEQIFQNFDVPQNPLICVTPVVDGKIITND